jgi:predicted ATP-binding protein involved in virulence
MQESIEIRNFCGIQHAEIDFKPVTVFIGESGTGKSMAMKLRYVFRRVIEAYENIKAWEAITGKEPDTPLNSIAVYIFKEYQLLQTNQGTHITYKYDNRIITLKFDPDTLYKFEFKNFENQINYLLEPQNDNYNPINDKRKTRIFSWEPYDYFSQYFIPEQRTFFAQFDHSIFTLSRGRNSLNRFLLDYGEIYRSAIFNFNSINALINNNIILLIQGTIEVINGNFFKIIYNDGRVVELELSASGHQNIVFLMLTLEELKRKFTTEEKKMVYIEEPELSLFPTAQKQIIEQLLSVRSEMSNGIEYTLTTHSPYILTSLNNLALAGKIIQVNPEKAEEVYKIIPAAHILAPEDLAAYEFKDGTALSLMDLDTGTIIAENLDQVSGTLGNDMDALFRIWHEGM